MKNKKKKPTKNKVNKKVVSHKCDPLYRPCLPDLNLECMLCGWSEV